jgi:hypothetical protein
VTATDAHGKAISESFNLAVGDTGHAGTDAHAQSNSDSSQAGTDAHAQSNADSGQHQDGNHGYSVSGSGNGNDTFFIDAHSGNNAITGNANWTDSIDLHNIGHNATFDVTTFDAQGHAAQSWTGVVADGSAQSNHDLSFTQGDHATITVNHVDGSASDHIALQNIDHIKY